MQRLSRPGAAGGRTHPSLGHDPQREHGTDDGGRHLLGSRRAAVRRFSGATLDRRGHLHGAAGYHVMNTTVDDNLWSAIGDPIRRTVIDLLLTAGPGTATSLSARLPVTRQAVSKHLAILNRVGLVHASPSGRERHYRVDEMQLARTVAQMSAVGAAWNALLRRAKETFSL